MMTFYTNRLNSCYIDSLLSILFLADMGSFVRRILQTNITRTTYRPSTVTSTSGITDIRQYAREVRTVIDRLFRDVQRERQSTELAKITSRADRAFTVGRMGNPAELYELLTALFPALLIEYARKESDGIHTRRQCLFDMTDVRTVRVQLRSWPSHLVFSNGGIEWYRGGARNLINWTDRGFGLELYGGLYRLVGAIVHVNQCHYVSYFRIRPDEPFYYYDDMHTQPQLLDELPTRGIFMDTTKRQPAMLFYVRM